MRIVYGVEMSEMCFEWHVRSSASAIRALQCKAESTDLLDECSWTCLLRVSYDNDGGGGVSCYIPMMLRCLVQVKLEWNKCEV